MDRIIVDDRRPLTTKKFAINSPTGVPRLDAEIGEILAGNAVGRRNNAERVLVLNLGIAARDISVAAEIYRRAIALGIGSKLCF